MDECRECYAQTDNLSRHRRWHEEQEQKRRKLERTIRDLEDQIQRG